MMDHMTKKGEPKIVEQCTYPLTGMRCVHRIYTDLAVLEVTPSGLSLIDVVQGLSSEELQRCTAPITSFPPASCYLRRDV